MEVNTKKSLVITRILVTLGAVAIVAFVFLAFGPNIERRPLPAYESSAVSSLRVIEAANATYTSEHPQQGYARNLSDLAADPRTRNGKAPDWAIGPVLASGQKTGYIFTYSAPSLKRDGKIDAFQITADPLVPGKTGNRHFFVDETGVIRVSKDGRANASSVVLQ